LGKEVSAVFGEDVGAGVFWAVAMMVDTRRNVRSRRICLGVPSGKRIPVSITVLSLGL
jgi:hypothetical protein